MTFKPDYHFDKLGKVPVRAALAAHLKRYGWLRLFDNFPAHPKWRVVARRIELPVNQVVSIALVLLCAANRGRPRGSVAEFSVDEAAAALDLPVENVARIYAALEEVGWIDQEYLVTWDERQPDKEDPTAAVRQQRRREKLKKKRLSTLPTGRHGVTSVTPRDVTPDKTRPVLEAGLGQSVENAGENLDAAVWLGGEGRDLVAERVGVSTERAAELITTWLDRVAGDRAALQLILRGAIAADYIGARFHNLVVDGYKRHGRPAQLPLPPVALKKKAMEG